MYRKKGLVIFALFFLGLLLVAYPVLQKNRSSQNIDRTLKQYEESLKKADEQMQRRLALQYNEGLREKKKNTEQGYLEALSIFDGIMGVLSIPEIGVELPIYHGVSEEVLTKGAGHLPESALPTGGDGNHTVLAGHTGLAGAELFTNLTRLQEGDFFSLSILGEILRYRVDRIKIVLPDDGEELAPVDGKDYCTLVTCTPYGINSHRLLVRGVRVENKP